MGYRLSVDLGTTNTAAVIHRPGTAPTVVSLGDRSATMPSVLFLGPEGTVLMGEAAERRALTDPDRVVRRFKRRIGDETPLLVGVEGDGLPAHAIAARMIALVADRVAAQEGGAPDAIAVTVPAAWGTHKKDLLAAALTREGLLAVTMVPEPAAAALAYAQTGRLGAGTTVAIYDLGGGTFDAALLRAETDGRFTPLGTPCGIPNLGGVDFDDAVLAYTLGIAGPQTPGIDHDDPAHLTALARLRRECVEAKEALSADTAVTVPVMLGGAQTSVRLTRGEFEAMIAGAVEETCTAVEATLVSAGLTRNNVDRILLAGGSSRIPLVTQLLSARYPGIALDRDIDPKLAVAIGGVLALEPAQGEREVRTGPAPAPVAAAAMSAKPARPVLELETFDGATEQERERPRTVVRPRRRTSKVFLAVATVAMIGGATLTDVGALDLDDILPNGTLQEARAVVPDETAELQIETTEVSKTEARAKEKAAKASKAAESGDSESEVAASGTTGSTSSTQAADSSAVTAGGRTEGSADTRSAESSDSDVQESAEATRADVASERATKAAADRRAADRKAARADRPQRPVADSGAGTPAVSPVDAAAAPSAAEAPAEVAAPAPAAEEDTSTESGSVEFHDSSSEDPPAAP